MDGQTNGKEIIENERQIITNHDFKNGPLIFYVGGQSKLVSSLILTKKGLDISNYNERKGTIAVHDLRTARIFWCNGCTLFKDSTQDTSKTPSLPQG